MRELIDACIRCISAATARARAREQLLRDAYISVLAGTTFPNDGNGIAEVDRAAIYVN